MWRAAGVTCGHVPKTGGTWSRKVAASVAGRRSLENVRTTHAPLWRVWRPQSQGLWVGTTRAPGDYYCSLFLHARNLDNGPTRNALECYGGSATCGFREFLYAVTHPDEALVPQYIGVVTQPANTPPECFEQSPFGLWTWMHRYTYGHRNAHRRTIDADYPDDWITHYLIDTTQGREAWGSFWGVDIDVESVNTRERYRNFVDTRPYRDWYDEEMVSWVEQADGELMQRTGRPGVFGKADSGVICMREDAPNTPGESDEGSNKVQGRPTD